MKKLYIIPLLILTTLGGCEKDVSTVPVTTITTQSFFKNQNDVEAAINGMYVRLRDMAETVELYAWGEARSELLGPAIAASAGFDIYYNNTLSTSGPGVGWGNLYEAVNAANLILKYAPTISFTSDAAKNDALAQAYTMRAFLYFVMGRTWGGVPIRTEATLGFDPVAIQIGRSTEAEVFTLIKDDLNKALALYSTNNYPAGRGKWTKAGANALKADVYLWTGKRLGGGAADFTTALTAATDVETSDVTLLPAFADVFRFTNKGNKEIIMEIKFSITEGVNQVWAHGMYAATLTFPAYVPQSQRDIVGAGLPGNGNVWRITDLVRNQFTNADTRKAATYIDMMGAGANEYYTNYGLKFNGTVDNGTRHMKSDYILYRLADVLLLKAEAKNALNQSPAIEMNRIRQRAYGSTYPVFVSGTQAANDDAILKERLFELALEGKRWWDLVRFGKAFTLVPSLQGKSSQTHLLYWPVGIATIAREPLVKENTGW